MPELDLSGVTLSDELRLLVISKVESGQFASEAAVVEAALRSYLIEGAAEEIPESSRVASSRPQRAPSPFIEDEWVLGPGDIPRQSGREVECLFLPGKMRQPDLYPGE